MYALAYWAFNLHQSLSPVFTDVECRLNMPKIKKVSFEGGFHVDFVSGTTCYNPNPYIVKMRSAKAVNVYMGPKFTKVASVVNIPESILPAKGEGTIDVAVTMAPTRQSWGAMFGTLFSSQTAIYVENSIELNIDINMFFMRFKVAKTFDKNCGFNLQVFRSALAKVGPLACTDDWKTLQIPEVGDEAFDGSLELYASNLADKEIKQGTAAKDIGLGIAMLSGCAWGTIFLISTCFGLYRCKRALGAPADAHAAGKTTQAAKKRGIGGSGAEGQTKEGKEEALRRKVVVQARELRDIKARLAEEEMRRKLAEQERELRSLKSKLAKKDGLGVDHVSVGIVGRGISESSLKQEA